MASSQVPFVNIEAYIDKIIEEFPGNKKLQRLLGLDSEVPYESLSDIPWHELCVQGALRIVLDNLIEMMAYQTERDESEFAMLRKVMKHTNRVLVMELILKSDGAVVEGTGKDILKLYIKIALPGYELCLNELMKDLQDHITEKFRKQEELKRFFDE